jgi:hypothetical protein
MNEPEEYDLSQFVGKDVALALKNRPKVARAEALLRER